MECYCERVRYYKWIGRIKHVLGEALCFIGGK